MFKSKPFKISAIIIAVLLIVGIPLTLGASYLRPAVTPTIVENSHQLPPTEEQLLTALVKPPLAIPTIVTTAVALKTDSDIKDATAAAEATKAAEAKKKAEAEAAAAKKKAEEEAKKKAEEEAKKKAEEEGKLPDGEEGAEGDTEEVDDLPATGGGSSLVNGGKIKCADLKRVANSEGYTVSQSFLNELSGLSTITQTEFLSLARRYGLSQTYVQRFVDDAFVYKMGNDYKFVSVDNSLRKNNYNWDYLVNYGNYREYVVNGSSRASKCIDVSYAQGDINWSQVKADGVNYAYIRLGRRTGAGGELGLDDKYHQNVRNAQAAGVKVGVYFYTQAINTAEAREEANYVLQHISDYNLDLPVMFDIEGGESAGFRAFNNSVSTNTAICKTFLDTVKNAGHPVILYSYAKFATERLDMSQLQQYDFWLAQYYPQPFFPYNFQYWQYTGSGRVAGIKGGVDMNLIFHDYRR